MKITRHGFAVIKNDTHIGLWAEQEGRLDHDQNVLPRVLPYIPTGGVVVDAGAYIGDHTIAYANKVGAEGTVMAFEPFLESFECLLHNMKGLPQVQCFLNALGDTNKHVKATCEIQNFGMAVTKEVQEVDDNTITVVKLDDYELKQLDLFKIDVEGDEIAVLDGARETIRTCRPVLFIEVNEHTLKLKGYTKNDLLKAVADLGYKYRNVYEGQGLQDDQFDILCFPV